MKNKSIFLIIGIYLNFSSAKIKIYTCAYNRPQYIEIQKLSLDKYIKEDFEYFVFNDSDEDNIAEKIEETCRNLNINHIRIPQGQEGPHRNFQSHYEGQDIKNFFDFKAKKALFRVNFRAGDVAQYMFEKIGLNNNDIVIHIDSDMFLINHISVRDFLGENHIAGQMINWNFFAYGSEGVGEYPLPFLIFYNTTKLPQKELINLRSGFIGSKWLDLGAFLSFYIKMFNLKTKTMINIPVRYFENEYSVSELKSIGFKEKEIAFSKKFNLIADDLRRKLQLNHIDEQLHFVSRFFLHFCCGSGWLDYGMEKEMNTYNEVKLKLIKEFISQ